MASAINETDLFKASADVIATEAADELLLLSLAHGRCYSMNVVGRNIWRALSEPITVANLIARLGGEFRQTPPDFGAEVIAVLDQLRSEDLIHQVEAKAA